jgi:RNA polymerase-binding transcription factor DksA
MSSQPWTAEHLKGVKRGTLEWHSFVDWQKERILERLQRYNNVQSVKAQLQGTGNLSTYQNYKITVVSSFLLQALEHMKNGNYGICTCCQSEIPVGRLLLVPGALRCMVCEAGQHPR